jgi:hypothetical protein
MVSSSRFMELASPYDTMNLADKRADESFLTKLLPYCAIVESGDGSIVHIIDKQLLSNKNKDYTLAANFNLQFEGSYRDLVLKLSPVSGGKHRLRINNVVPIGNLVANDFSGLLVKWTKPGSFSARDIISECFPRRSILWTAVTDVSTGQTLIDVPVYDGLWAEIRDLPLAPHKGIETLDDSAK